jgi:hypothetical protein
MAGCSSMNSWRTIRNSATPTGTLMKKIHSHPTVSVITPLSSTPTAAPEAPTPPHIPRARLRSSPSGKIVVRIESAAGAIIAAPKPWTPRAITSTEKLGASPAVSDASAKIVSPASSTGLRPRRSARRPPSMRKPPSISP